MSLTVRELRKRDIRVGEYLVGERLPDMEEMFTRRLWGRRWGRRERVERRVPW